MFSSSLSLVINIIVVNQYSIFNIQQKYLEHIDITASEFQGNPFLNFFQKELKTKIQLQDKFYNATSYFIKTTPQQP